jgi:pyridoxal phosphate enzyme (YggS family)
MTTAIALKDRYAEVQARVAEAARRVGRKPADLVVVAVTKYAEPDQIRALVQLGHRDLGENQVQQLIQRAPMVDEFLARHRALPLTPRTAGASGRSAAGVAATGVLFPEPRATSTPKKPEATPGAFALPDSVRWHMIGHLQRNKVRKAVEFCRLIHSVDSLRLAEEIQQVAAKRHTPVDILLQVNCSGEPTKFGCPPPAAVPMAEQIDTMVDVRLRGVMTMAAPGIGPDETKATFARCREVFEDIRSAGLGEGAFNILSMGMSSDYELAIAMGANMLRIGTAIFGEPRPGAGSDQDQTGDESE